MDLFNIFGVHAKTITALVGEAITLATFYWGGSNHWVVLAIAIASVLGVYAIPNVPATPVPPVSPPVSPLEPHEPAPAEPAV